MLISYNIGFKVSIFKDQEIFLNNKSFSLPGRPTLNLYVLMTKLQNTLSITKMIKKRIYTHVKRFLTQFSQ